MEFFCEKKIVSYLLRLFDMYVRVSLKVEYLSHICKKVIIALFVLQISSRPYLELLVECLENDIKSIHCLNLIDFSVVHIFVHQNIKYHS